MYNVLKSEFLKLKKSLAFKIIILSTIMGCLIVSAVGEVISDQEVVEQLSAIEGTNIDFTATDYKSNSTGIETFILGFADTSMIIIVGIALAGLFIGSDFENRTIQQGISSGKSRATLLFSKVIVYFVAIFFILITYILIPVSISTLMYGFGASLTMDLFLQLLSSFSTYYLLNMAMLSSCIFLAYAFKKSSHVISIGVGIVFFGSDVLLTFAQMSSEIKDILTYTPLGVKLNLSNLTSLESLPSDILNAGAINFIYIAIFIGLSYLVFRKSELK